MDLGDLIAVCAAMGGCFWLLEITLTKVIRDHTDRRWLQLRRELLEVVKSDLVLLTKADQVHPDQVMDEDAEIRQFVADVFNSGESKVVILDARSKPRTVAEVMAERDTPGGCCDRHADNSSCDCLAEAREYEKVRKVRCHMCGDSGYVGNPANGRNRNAYRCPNRCPVRCGICCNPECDNLNGQH